MGAVNAWMLLSVITLCIPELRDLGDVAGYTSFELLAGLLCSIASLIRNFNTAKKCCYVICVNSSRHGNDRRGVNMAISRAAQFWWVGLIAFTASWPMYLWFLFGPIPAILLLTYFILSGLCSHFIGTQREIQEDNQYNNHRPQSELLTHVLWKAGFCQKEVLISYPWIVYNYFEIPIGISGCIYMWVCCII